MLKLKRRLRANRIIEIFANLGIVVVAILLSATLIKNYTATDGNAARAEQPAVRGRKITLPGVDWSKNGRTLVLALQAGCKYCTASSSFYRKLVEKQSNRPGVHLLAVFPQPAGEGINYLNSLGVSVNDVRQAPLGSVGVSGTPTILLVDGGGVIVNAWVGRLDSFGEAEVLSLLNN